MNEVMVKNAVEKISRFYGTLEEAKQDYDAKVKAELNLLSAEMVGGLTPSEAKNIKKAGEALAKEKADEMRADAVNLADILEITMR